MPSTARRAALRDRRVELAARERALVDEAGRGAAREEHVARLPAAGARLPYRAPMRGIVTVTITVLVALAGAARAEDLSGDWIFTEQVFGLRRGARLTLKQDGARLAGTLAD